MSSLPKIESETADQHMHRTHVFWKRLLCRLRLDTVVQRLVAIHVKAAFRLAEHTRCNALTSQVSNFLDVQW